MPKKGMDKMGKEHNEKYKGMIRGNAGKGMEVMMNHGNVYAIDADAQKFDMDRIKPSDYEYKGYDMKAHDYKY